MEDAENTSNKVPNVKVSAWLIEELKDLQHAEEKQTKVKPTYADLLDRAWKAYKGGSRQQPTDDVLQKSNLKHVLDFQGRPAPQFLKPLLQDAKAVFQSRDPDVIRLATTAFEFIAKIAKAKQATQADKPARAGAK